MTSSTIEATDRRRRTRAAALVLGAALVAASSSRSPAPIRRAEGLAAADGVPAGASLEVAFRVRLEDGFHVNSHVPSQEFLIPTTLEVEPAGGLHFDEWIYPPGEERRFPFSEEPLQVYEGVFLIRGRVRVSAGMAPATQRLIARLRYQACTREKCLPPKQEEIALEIRVVPAGTRTRRVHPEVFPSPRR